MSTFCVKKSHEQFILHGMMKQTPLSPNNNPQEQGDSPMLTRALRQVLRPLVRLMLARGVTYPYLAELLKGLFVEVADQDERINAAWPAYEAALKAAGAQYEMHQYAGTQHGFNNDTTPRYDAGAAQLAWGRTVEFFKRHLA